MTCSRRRRGTPSSRTSTTTATSISSSPRATSTPSPTTPTAIRATSCSARADGTFVESAGAAGILDYRPARGAALVDLNHDGMLDLVVVHRGDNVTLWRNTGRGDAGKPEAMGNWIDVRRPPTGTERRRDRSLDRRADRRSRRDPRAHDRRRARRRTARLGPLRARPGRAGGGPGRVARRRGRPVEDGGGRHADDHRPGRQAGR